MDETEAGRDGREHGATQMRKLVTDQEICQNLDFYVPNGSQLQNFVAVTTKHNRQQNQVHIHEQSYKILLLKKSRKITAAAELQTLCLKVLYLHLPLVQSHTILQQAMVEKAYERIY